MARISNNEKLRRIHQEALREFDEIQAVMRDERLQCLQDRRFATIAGAQWEGELAEQFKNKPKFEMNKIRNGCLRIMNEYRNNRITVDFFSKDGAADDKLADTCDSLYRADEQDSVADEAYDNSFDEALGGGFGAFRLRTVYEDEDDDDNDDQRIRFEPITDADSSVFFDLGAKRQDKSDAKRCYVLTPYTVAAYIEEFDDDPATWPKEVSQSEFDWAAPDQVFVCEHYRVETVSDTVRTWRAIDGSEDRYTDADFEADDELEMTLLAVGSKEVGQKKVRRRRVHKYILSGSGVLEDCGFVAGKHIPIVPVYGQRWFVDGVERCMGHVRLAKDAQRLGNMLRSKLAEISAISSVEKPILTPEQVAGHQMMWAENDAKDYPYLLINPITDAAGNQMVSGPIGYTKPPAIPPALAALLQIVEQDVKDLLGNQEQGQQVVSNISGKAVEMIQQRLDMQSHIYVSNMAKAIRRAGEIWLSMAKEILNQPGRKLKGLTPQGEPTQIEIGRKRISQDGMEVVENDLSRANLDVVATAGPSSDSKRAATVRALTGMMAITQDPETSMVLQSMAMMNMEGEGLADVRDFFRQKLLRMGAVKPTDEEIQQMAAEKQGQQPDPNAIYLQAAAEEANAKGAKARAETVKVIADAELSRAKTIETMAGIDMSTQDHAMAMMQQMPPADGLPADYGQVADSSQLQIPEELAAAIMAQPDPQAIMYALAQQPEAVAQLSQLPPEQMAAVLAQIGG